MVERLTDRHVMRTAIRAGSSVIVVVELLIFVGGFALGWVTGQC